MQRNRVLALLVILAAALVFWLMPREGSPPNVAFEPQDTPSVKPAPAATPAEPETPSPPMVSDAAPKTPPTPATPETLAVPTWEPLPPVPAPRFRKLTPEDFGLAGEAEIARLRASVATMRFRVTIRGRVLDGAGAPVARANVCAHSCGVSAQNMSADRPEFKVFCIRHPADPAGTAITNETGEYVLELQVTGSDVAGLLRAVKADEGEAAQARGKFQAEVIVRAEAPDRRGNGRLVALHPEATAENIDLTLHDGPFVTLAVRSRAGNPVPGAHLECRLTKPMDPAAGRGSDWKVYADEEGLIHLPREDGWQYTLLVNNGYNTMRRVLGPMAEHFANKPIALETSEPTEDERLVVFRPLREGTPDAPEAVMYVVLERAAMKPDRAGIEGWLCARQLPQAGKDFVLFAQGCGLVRLPLPDIPAGHCAEYEPLVFPTARDVQLRIVDERGKPVQEARIEGRVVDPFRAPPEPRPIEHLPSGAVTDADGRVNVRVLPGRPYRMMATLKSGKTAIKRDWIFTGPGPHEWHWQSESGK